MIGGAGGRRLRWALACTLGVVLVTAPLLTEVASNGVVSMPAAAAAPPAPGPTTDGPGRPEPGASGPTRAFAPAQRSATPADAVAAAERAAAGSTQLGVAVLDRRTGAVAAGERGAEPFYTASLSKVVLAVDMLDRRRLDGLTVTEDDLALLRRALGPSDDPAMNVLWTRFDGPNAALRVAQRTGIAVNGPADPSQWGEMEISAVALAELFRYVLEDLPAADSALLVGAMDAAPRTARDGFDQGFGLMAAAVDGPDGPGAVAKQGWMCCFSRRYYLHSAGAVGEDLRRVVVVLTRIPRDGGWDAARAEVTEVAVAAVGAGTAR